MFLKTFAFIFLIGHLGFAATFVNVPAQKLISTAVEKKISSTRAWQKLLHIERNAFFVRKGQIADPRFYNSEKGRGDPEAELVATISAFFKPIDQFVDLTKPEVIDHSQHPICRFPARLAYLQSKIDDSESWSQLPKPNCHYFKIFERAIAAESVSFVFSSFYPDSPGSAFGHTLFRINKKSGSNGSQKQELLDYGVGFAANVGNADPFSYAIGGIAGGFTGTWTNLPYYYKVREYNDFEARDLWSYELALEPHEVKMLVMHLWEIGPQNFTYYFFTQNCAYHMLTALEAAAPRLHLSDQVPFLFVIPSDALKAVNQSPGLVKSIDYRPSVRRSFLTRYSQLDPKLKIKFQEYVKKQEFASDFESWDLVSKAEFLDTAIDLHSMKFPTITPESNPVQYNIKQNLYLARAKVDTISPQLKMPVIETEQPQLSHASSRIGLYYFERQEFTLEYRFTLHDLLDNNLGLPANSLLEFGRVEIKNNPELTRLEEFSLFRVFNLNPVEFYSKKLSWGFDLGVKTFSSCSDSQSCYGTGFDSKFGYSKKIGTSVGWFMATAGAYYGPGFEKSYWHLAPGYEVGVLFNQSEKLAMLATYNQEFPINRILNDDWSIKFRYHLKLNFEVEISKSKDQAGVGLYYFY